MNWMHCWMDGKRVAGVFLAAALCFFVAGCPFEDDDKFPLPKGEDEAPKVVVVLNDTGEIADITVGGKRYQIDITGQGGVLDKDSIDILGVNEVAANLFPPGFSFPDGLITFKVTGLNPGDAIDVLLTFPSDFPAGSQYYKVTDAGYVFYANAVFNGNQVTLALTDGLDGDLDKIQNGEILDPGGPALEDATIPQFTLYPSKIVLGVSETPSLKGDGQRKGGPGFALVYLNTAHPYTMWFIDTRSLPEWLYVYPQSGSGPAVLTVSGCYTMSPLGTTWTNIVVSDSSGASRTLKTGTYKKDPEDLNPPFGAFDTPLNNSAVQSSVPVTGWVLDDVGVDSVKIFNTTGGGNTYVGDAVFVEGSRPDVAYQYPNYPNNSQAGWGYMMLTNFLPNGGNGTYTIEARATDWEGNETSLGTKTITCDNANAVKPFGALDTPQQGGTASGSSYINWGWALTPQPNSIPSDGSTINVYLDGVYAGHPVYNQYRQDIADLFPGYNNSGGAAGFFELDTTAYQNGLHTIQWTATDTAGNNDGIGSRYFTINNAQ